MHLPVGQRGRSAAGTGGICSTLGLQVSIEQSQLAQLLGKSQHHVPLSG